jgi:hypothetical protein
LSAAVSLTNGVSINNPEASGLTHSLLVEQSG